MNLHIQTKSSEPIYIQIGNQLKDEIIAGRLKPGDSLPSIRGLAADLKISVITTKKAYEELEQEGMVYSVPGKGFFVDNPDIQYLEEKKTKGIETKISELISDCKKADLSKRDVLEMIDILWEEEIC